MIERKNVMNMHPTPLISLSLPVHIGFMIISLIVLLLCYKAKKQLHQLLLLAAILSSGLIYFVQPGISFYILAFEEIALFISVIVCMIVESRKAKAKAANAKSKAKRYAEGDNK